MAKGFLLAAVTVVAALFSQVCYAVDHKVGGDGQWKLVGTPSYYQDWVKQNKFQVGDTITFNYQNPQHDVAEVSETDYTTCMPTAPNRLTTGADKITLAKSGTHYFICTVNGHCGAGMKFSVTALAGTPPPTKNATAPAAAKPPVAAKSPPAPPPADGPEAAGEPIATPAPTPDAEGPALEIPKLPPTPSPTAGVNATSSPGNGAASVFPAFSVLGLGLVVVGLL